MGLDMYLEGKKYIWTDWAHPEKSVMEDGFKLREKTLELGYWRKHPNLHGYIVQNFAHGVDNCLDIDLNIENLEQLLSAVESDSLPETQGFFFGTSLPEDKEPSINILHGAIKWLKEKETGVSRSVVYRASW